MAWIGLDLGGTKIYGAVLRNGRVRQEAKRRTPTEGGPAAVVAAMAAVVGDLGGAKKVKGIGVGAPGLIDRRRGLLKHAPNLAAWTDDYPLGPALAEAVGCRAEVVLGNDVEVGVLGEHRLGAARGCGNVLGVWLGTGVGGGLVLDGRIFKGAHGLAGEVGHTLVHPGGLECGCGGHGHLEAYAGRASMERRARAAVVAGRTSLLVDLAGPDRMKSSVFARAIEAGDPLALELIEEAVAAVAITVASLQTLLDLEIVVLGGGMGERLGAALAPRIEAQARTMMLVPKARMRVTPAALGDASGAAGAALMAKAAAG